MIIQPPPPPFEDLAHPLLIRLVLAFVQRRSAILIRHASRVFPVAKPAEVRRHVFDVANVLGHIDRRRSQALRESLCAVVRVAGFLALLPGLGAYLAITDLHPFIGARLGAPDVGSVATDLVGSFL